MSIFYGDNCAEECAALLAKWQVVEAPGIDPKLAAEITAEAIRLCNSVSSASHLCRDVARTLRKWVGR